MTTSTALLPPLRSVKVRILGFLKGEHRLLAQLLYGTGMRISGGLQLRVKDLEFDHCTVIVREERELQG